MRPRGRHPPQTPAERQAKCRAVKRGEWYTIQALPDDQTPALPPPTGRAITTQPAPPRLPAPAGPANSQPTLPAPPAPPALPARPLTAVQWGLPTSKPATAAPSPAPAPAPAPPDTSGPGDAWRLSLPPAVAARLRSLLDRHEAGKPLTAAERAEAQGLLDIAEYLVVQRLRQRLAA